MRVHVRVRVCICVCARARACVCACVCDASSLSSSARVFLFLLKLLSLSCILRIPHRSDHHSRLSNARDEVKASGAVAMFRYVCALRARAYARTRARLVVCFAASLLHMTQTACPLTHDVVALPTQSQARRFFQRVSVSQDRLNLKLGVKCKLYNTHNRLSQPRTG
jgi:hypothetical protein